MIEVRTGTAEHVPDLVQIHTQAFKGFTLTLLGARFLTLLYRRFIEHHNGIVLIASDESLAKQNKAPPLGFLVGTKDPAGFFKYLRRRYGALFLIAAAPALFKHPLVVIERLWAACRYRGDDLVVPHGYWLLSSLAVLPSQSGRGVGAKLVDEYCKMAKIEAVPGVYLSTDADGNDRVHAFYLRNGFKAYSYVVRPNGRRMTIYAREL